MTYDIDCCPLTYSFCQISQILTPLQSFSSFGLHFLFDLHSCLKAVEFRGDTLSLIPQSRKVLLSDSAKALWELCRFLTSSFAKICFPQLPYIDNDLSLLKTIFFFFKFREIFELTQRTMVEGKSQNFPYYCQTLLCMKEHNRVSIEQGNSTWDHQCVRYKTHFVCEPGVFRVKHTKEE